MVIMVTTNYTFSKIFLLLPSSVASIVYIYIYIYIYIFLKTKKQPQELHGPHIYHFIFFLKSKTERRISRPAGPHLEKTSETI